MEKNFTDANFEAELASGLPVVIDFSATWCGPCKRIAPIIAELADEYEGRVIIGKCDVDDSDVLTARFGIRNVPTVVFLKDGKEVDRNIGASPKSVFVEKIEALLA